MFLVNLRLLNIPMKKSILFFVSFIIFGQIFSQSAREVGVELRATLTQDNYMQISWLQQSGSTRYQVYTKNANGASWDRIADLKGNDTLFVDSTYLLGTRKEYRVARTSSNYTGFDGNGYMVAGFDVPAAKKLGRALVLIEDIYQTTAVDLMAQYLNQIQNEGYQVDTHYVNKNDKVTDVKDWIFKQWSNDKNSFTTVLLLGRIPVPYSGNYRPDGHTDHTGAWPADLYYGAFDISWTDNSVSNTSATFSRNHNKPGDGKFDLSRYNIPSKSLTEYVNIPVGRVDLTNMPSFGNDTNLLKRYLNKSLAFRTGVHKARLKSLVDDNFGYFGSEAFASGGFRNGSVFSAWDISTGDYRNEMSKNSFLLSYGCGPGSYTSCAGVSTSNDFVNDSLLNPFTLTFGSYYGDWDNANNFLRAPLASRGWGLASVWSGRPYWMMHACAHGAPLAEATINTYNTWNLYNAAGFQAGVHVALMGDPTLRMFAVDNVHDLEVESHCDARVTLEWGKIQDLADSVIIERWDGSDWKSNGVYKGTDTAANFYLGTGKHTLSIRFLKLMESASGTWWQYGARRIEDVAVDTIPAGKITGNISNAYCSDSTYIFVNDGNFDSRVISSWTWNGVNTTSPKGDTLRIENLSKGGTLFITRFSPGGCIYVDSVNIQIQKMDWPLETQIKSHYCLETDYVFNDVKAADSSIYNDWTWNGITQKRNQGDTIGIRYNQTGAAVLYVKRESRYGCVYRDSWTLAFSKPNKPVIVEVENLGRIGDTIKLKAGNVHYLYGWNDNNPDTDSTFVFVASAEKETVRLQGYDSMGCMSEITEQDFVFVVNQKSSMRANDIVAYPNPMGNQLWISLPKGEGVWQVNVTNINGANCLRAQAQGGLNTLNVEPLPNGVYLISIQEVSSGAHTVLRIIK